MHNQKTVVIVGRPNVGKSTLFNKICRQRRAIVADLPGITRDRIYSPAEWNNHNFEIVDTGGLVPNERDSLLRFILEQAALAIEEADLILFLVNGREGMTPQDEEVATFLRPHASKVLIAVNQMDPPVKYEWAAPFYKLGMSMVLPVSAEHNAGLSTLLDWIVQRLFTGSEDFEPGPIMGKGEVRVAIIGRPNVGKSTFLNSLIGKPRVIVSPIPGTTRDAVDSLYVRGNTQYRFIDTAGIRRKGKTSGQIESLSVIMAHKSLQRADVALLLLDGVEGVTKLDAEIGGLAIEAGCSLLLVTNKKDLFKPNRQMEIMDELDRKMKFIEYVPRFFISARNGVSVGKLLPFVDRAAKARLRRITTSQLNNKFLPQVREYLTQSGRMNALPANFLTQVGIAPPTFVIFAGQKRRLHFSMERFLLNRLRKQFGFYATPLRLLSRKR